MKHLLHVHHFGKMKFDFRLTILGVRFRSLETWHSPRDAAFWADCLKFYIRSKFKVLGSSTSPTLDPDVFTDCAEKTGVNLADLSQLLTALPPSSRDFLLYANDQFCEFVETRTKAVQELDELKEQSRVAKKARELEKMKVFVEKEKARISSLTPAP